MKLINATERIKELRSTKDYKIRTKLSCVGDTIEDSVDNLFDRLKESTLYHKDMSLVNNKFLKTN